jgi:hypothetical protein
VVWCVSFNGYTMPRLREDLAMGNRLKWLLHSETAYTVGVIGLGMLSVVLVIALIFR